VVDFTSALYLGLEHAWRRLPHWEKLTLGKPAALEEPPGVREVERELAKLSGCAQVVLAPSTLHLFWDLFGILAPKGSAIFLDSGSYPIARWGVERAAAGGVIVRVFRHHDPVNLRNFLQRIRPHRPVIVADGFCPVHSRAAPIAEYLRCIEPFDGCVVIDDTQSIGIFGADPASWPPYGRGGGGSLKHARIDDSRVVVVSSLAKAFGVPVAMLGGAQDKVNSFQLRSATRTHCSPPSAAVIAAASHALHVNGRCGDTLRLRLAERVGYFRRRLKLLKLEVGTGFFPVQTLQLAPHMDVSALHRSLLKRGVRTVLHRAEDGGNPRLSFVITARHTMSEISRAADVLADAIARCDAVAAV
jgi:8-amino-7-oxononanoate synthase